MDLHISSKNHNNITLTIKQGRRVVDTVDFGFDKNLDNEIIQSIDKLLKRNKIDIQSLGRVKVAKNIDKTSSTHRILQTWVQAFVFVKNDRFSM